MGCQHTRMPDACKEELPNLAPAYCLLVGLPLLCWGEAAMTGGAEKEGVLELGPIWGFVFQLWPSL